MKARMILRATRAAAFAVTIALTTTALAQESGNSPRTTAGNASMLAQAPQQELEKAEAARRALEDAAATMQGAEGAAREALQKAIETRKALESAMKEQLDKAEAAQRKLENATAARIALEKAAREESQKAEAARRNLERAAAAQDAERAEAARKDQMRAEVAKREAERAEAAKREADRAEAARKEQERAAAAKRDAERAEVAKKELDAARRKLDVDSTVALAAEARYLRGLQLERAGEIRSALVEFEAAANNNHAFAQKKLGDLYGTGSASVQRDYETSLKWYSRARESGVEIPLPIRR